MELGETLKAQSDRIAELEAKVDRLLEEKGRLMAHLEAAEDDIKQLKDQASAYPWDRHVVKELAAMEMAMCCKRAMNMFPLGWAMSDVMKLWRETQKEPRR